MNALHSTHVKPIPTQPQKKLGPPSVEELYLQGLFNRLTHSCQPPYPPCVSYPNSLIGITDDGRKVIYHIDRMGPGKQDVVTLSVQIKGTNNFYNLSTGNSLTDCVLEASGQNADGTTQFFHYQLFDCEKFPENLDPEEEFKNGPAKQTEQKQKKLEKAPTKDAEQKPVLNS